MPVVPPGPMAPDAQAAPETVAPGALSALLADLVRGPEAAAEAVEPAPGTVIGRFELVRRLGAGGFGVVWEARDRQLGRKVAFKLIRPGRRAELREESLLREAEAAARLSHDNIVALHDVGQSDHGPYLVLELLRGTTLAARLAAGPVPLLDAVRIVRDVARGVAHAHAGGVVHRDLKPANVFLCDDGRVKVLDFGLAHAFGRRRQSGGTPAYMAPEQWRDAPEDERTDVFALGVILHQALSGTLPFGTEQEAVGKRPAPVLEIEAAPELGPLLARMLAKDPLRRPRDAGEVLAALDACLVRLERTGTVSSPVRTRRHPRWRLAAVVVAGIVIGVAAAVGVTVARRAPSGAGGRQLVAVADVVNETGERELDVLSGALITSLEQSRKLEVMTQARVLDLAARGGRPGATRVDETIGRAVGLETRAAALLLPAVRRIGSTYAVELRVIDPVNDRHLFTVSDRATSRDGLFDLLDRLSEKARQELNEDPTELARNSIRLGEAMTRSVEAYQHYVAGVEAMVRDQQPAAALREEQQAVRLDPQFAAAHRYLAALYSFYQRPDLAAPHRLAANAFADRLPEKERSTQRLARLSGAESSPEKNVAEALQLAAQLVDRYPNDKLVLARAAEAYGRLHLPERQEPALRAAYELDPGGAVVAGWLMDLLISQGRTGEAVVVARRAVATRHSAANLKVLAQALLAAGDDAGAAAAAREGIWADDGQSEAFEACWVLDRVGAGRECLPFWEKVMAEGANEFERDRGRRSLVGGLAAQGRVRDALRLSGSVEEVRRGSPAFLMTVNEIGHPRLDAPEALTQARRLPGKSFRRMKLASFGSLQEAEQVTAGMAVGDADPFWDKWYQAFVLGAQGRHEEAIALWRQLGVEDDGLDDHLMAYRMTYHLAESLLVAGRPAEAVAVQLPKRAHRFVDPKDKAVGWPRLVLVRARALEQLGRRADAARELDGLLSYWQEADADLPLLVEARATRARLEGSGK